MSFPIPSFFKIRCGIIIIAFLLFFMLVGFAKQVFAIDSASYTETFRHQYPTGAQAYAACLTFSNYHHHEGPLSAGDYGDGLRSAYSFYIAYSHTPNGVDWYYGIYEINSSASSCPDSNSNGIPDACETCPKQQGYKTNLLIASYCGNTITQCDGSSHTSYEWGFGPDSCTPVQEPECHTTSDCKKDSNQDGIADGQEGGGSYSGNPKADLDGDGIPDLKDCDYDFDGDGKKNCEDPCPLRANPGTAICPDVCAGGTPDCEDADGDGVPDCTCPYGGECWTCADADYDGLPNGVDNDIDGDGIPNAQDSDVDGDGISNAQDNDIDGDGIPNADDPDDDGDGAPDGPDTDGDGIPDSEDTDDDGDGVPDSEEETTTKPYESKAQPYAVNEETSSAFKEALKARFQEFLDKLKTTSLFSIPSRLSNIVPSGSRETKIAVDGGQTYGQHEVDFSGWTQGLAALNALVYMACYFLAIRIIILKR
jgi:hypothetical protein